MKKGLFIGLAVVLVLTTLVSVTSLAKGAPSPPQPPRTERFTSVITPTAIDAPVISTAPWPKAAPAGSNSWPILSIVGGKPTVVGWIVDSRSIYGVVTGGLTGVGTFTYGGILDLLQSGSIQGVLVINTGALDSLYMATSGTLAASVIEYYTFLDIVTWCQAAGFPVGMFFAQVYNAPQLALLPDGNMTFEQLQAWCGAIEIPIVQFFYGVYGDLPPPGTDNPDEATLKAMYEGGLIPPIPGLGILKGIYDGNPLLSLPKTLSAEFSGTLRVDKGTGVYSGASGQGQIGPYNKKPLTLYVSPAQHVDKVVGSVQVSGTYIKKPVHDRNVDKENLRDSIRKWKNNHKD